MFANLIESESGWDPTKISPTGDYGLLQINPRWHPEVASTTILEPIEAMRWAAQRIKDGYAHEWVVCSCSSFAHVLNPKIPIKNAEDYTPNGAPTIGGLVLLKYPKAAHVAVITGFTGNGVTVRETNYEPCKMGRREILFTDPALVGFWNPPTS